MVMLIESVCPAQGGPEARGAAVASVPGPWAGSAPAATAAVGFL